MDSPSIDSHKNSESPRSAFQGVGIPRPIGRDNETSEASVDKKPNADAQQAAESLRRLSHLASWLDDRFAIPGTNMRFGMDSVIGLVPGVGDLVGASLSGYIVLEGRRLGVPKRLITKMVGNIAIDAVIGVIPIIGDLADIQWKANRKNVHLLIDHLHGNHRSRDEDAGRA